jgi:hypothetical protein
VFAVSKILKPVLVIAVLRILSSALFKKNSDLAWLYISVNPSIPEASTGGSRMSSRPTWAYMARTCLKIKKTK